MKKIGVAIPCYIGHITNLKYLLDSIERQTRKPDKVVVSCSSINEDITIELPSYSFNLEIIRTVEHKNAGQNRNIAIQKLKEMDYISYIDADDIMHPQRIEILMKIFEYTDCDIILHNYKEDNDDFNEIKSFKYRINELKCCHSGCITHNNIKFMHEKIHHSQPSIKRYISDNIFFTENPEVQGKEDCIYCFTIFSIPNIKNVYICNELSYYKSNKTNLFIN